MSNVETREVARRRPELGLMIQPGNNYHSQILLYSAFGADNGCYGNKFHPDRWKRMLDHAAMYPERCLFAAVPDRFDPSDLAGNHKATLDLWPQYRDEVIDRGLAPAFVCQNGSTPDDVPPDAEAVFIGGGPEGGIEYKLSRWAWAHIAAAKARGRHAHVGRVNTSLRWGTVRAMGADSCDGTLVMHGPRDVMISKLESMLDHPPQLEFVP